MKNEKKIYTNLNFFLVKITKQINLIFFSFQKLFKHYANKNFDKNKIAYFNFFNLSNSTLLDNIVN